MRETDSLFCPEKALSWQTERTLTPEEESDVLLDPSRRKEKEAIIKKKGRKPANPDALPLPFHISLITHYIRKKEEGAHFSGEWFSLLSLFCYWGKRKGKKSFFVRQRCVLHSCFFSSLSVHPNKKTEERRKGRRRLLSVSRILLMGKIKKERLSKRKTSTASGLFPCKSTNEEN